MNTLIALLNHVEKLIVLFLFNFIVSYIFFSNVAVSEVIVYAICNYIVFLIWESNVRLRK